MDIDSSTGSKTWPERAILENWRTARHCRWAFHRVRELLPTADIPNDPDRVVTSPLDIANPGSLGFDPDPASPASLDHFLEEADCDGIVLLVGGRCVLERYPGSMERAEPHILMSVSKSLLGLVVGEVFNDRELDGPVEAYVPELAASAFSGASVRNLLDMRVGVSFTEDYTAVAGPMVRYRQATGWDPQDRTGEPLDQRSFLAGITERAARHGRKFSYVSPATDALGWVIERKTSVPYADLVSKLLWEPMAASRSAYITLDRLGAPRCAGGFCSTVRDLARVGQVVLEGGRFMGRRILCSDWLDDIARGGDPDLWVGGAMAALLREFPIQYRSLWYRLAGSRPVLFALGIHGQHLFIVPSSRMVLAMVSSQGVPFELHSISRALRFAERLAAALT